MKITEIANKMERTAENECPFSIELLWNSLIGGPYRYFNPHLKIDSNILNDNRIKAYWLQLESGLGSLGTIPFGIITYFFDNELIAISKKKFTGNIYWANSSMAKKAKDYFNSFYSDDEALILPDKPLLLFLTPQSTSFKLWDESEEIPDTYKLSYVPEVKFWSKARYNGMKINKVISTITPKELIIELENGENIETSMDNIIFLSNIIN